MLSVRGARPLVVRRAVVAFAAMAAATVMVACGDGGSSASPDRGLDGGESDTKVVGVAESTDDVGSQDRSPMAEGTLLVLPRDDADRLWATIEHSPSEPELPYVGGLLDSADVQPWELVTIDDGRFGLDAHDGAYLVCLLSGEYLLNGCGEATVDGPTTWSVSSGEGGFEIQSS